MILVMRKTNLLLVLMIAVLAIGIVGVNIGFTEAEESVSGAVTTLTTAGKIVVLDPGHGGEDPGAVSSYSGAKEKDINLLIAKKTKKLLEDAGYTVIMTREEDILQYDSEDITMTAKRKQDLLARRKLMDECGGDIVVSIHLNSFTDSKYSGAQTFYTKNSMSGKKLAMCLQNALREIDEKNEREALLKTNDIIITKDCKVTLVIVECGFLSNEEEEKKLISDDYQNRIAESIKKGIDEYFTVEIPSRKKE